MDQRCPPDRSPANLISNHTAFQPLNATIYAHFKECRFVSDAGSARILILIMAAMLLNPTSSCTSSNPANPTTLRVHTGSRVP